jgi:hypothetical protein
VSPEIPRREPRDSDRIALPRRTSAEVREVVDFHARGDFAQAMPTRREESAEQAAALELLEPALPALGARAESLEDSRHLG